MMQVIRVCDYDEFVGWVSSQGRKARVYACVPGSQIHYSLLKATLGRCLGTANACFHGP